MSVAAFCLDQALADRKCYVVLDIEVLIRSFSKLLFSH